MTETKVKVWKVECCCDLTEMEDTSMHPESTFQTYRCPKCKNGVRIHINFGEPVNEALRVLYQAQTIR